AFFCCLTLARSGLRWHDERKKGPPASTYTAHRCGNHHEGPMNSLLRILAIASLSAGTVTFAQSASSSATADSQSSISSRPVASQSNLNSQDSLAAKPGSLSGSTASKATSQSSLAPKSGAASAKAAD